MYQAEGMIVTGKLRSKLDPYENQILLWLANDPNLSQSDIRDKLKAEFNLDVRRETVCFWLKKRPYVKNKLVELQEREKQLGKRRFVTVMADLEDLVNANKVLYKRISDMFDEKDNLILDNIEFKDFVQFQNSMTKQLELMAKLRGDIQTGNKITLNFAQGGEDKKFMAWLNKKIKNIDKGRDLKMWIEEYHKETTRQADEIEYIDVEFKEGEEDDDSDETGPGQTELHRDEPVVSEPSDDGEEP